MLLIFNKVLKKLQKVLDGEKIKVYNNKIYKKP